MEPARSNRRTERRRQRAEIPFLKLPFQQPRNPFPPLDILSPEQLQRLHNASMHILENIGIDFLDAEALDVWQQAGAKVDHSHQHVWLDQGLVMELVGKAPASFTWRARNPAHNLFIGQNMLTFGPCGGMVYVVNAENGRKPGTFAHLQELVKISQLSPLLHFASWEQVAPQDIPPSTRHLHRVYTGYTLTDKVVMDGGHGRIITQDCLDMAKIVFGDLSGDPVIGEVINVNSPLRYDERMLGGLITYARAGQVTYITPFILAGAMSPITMAAALAQQNAETLAGIALAQLLRPGAPVIYGGFTTNVDMKSGSPAFGTPEGAWALLVGGQLARRYNLPYRGSGSLTNAKLPDAQAMYETLWTLWPAVQAHTNLLAHAVGWLDGGLTVSYEKFIIDMEQLAMFCHFLQGLTIDENSLALDMIAEVGPGGHHFGTSHTQSRYSTEFYQSTLSDRMGYDGWLQAGGQTVVQKAHGIWREMLAQYEAPWLDPSIQQTLHEFVIQRESELAGKNLYD